MTESLYIETSLLICYANQWTGFYMIGNSVVKELSNFDYIYFTFTVILFLATITHWIAKKFWENSQQQFSRKRKCLNEQDTHKFVTLKLGRKSWGWKRKRKEDNIIRYDCREHWENCASKPNHTVAILEKILEILQS